MRLNIASGGKRISGFTNIDIDPEHKPDIVGDFRTMDFKDIEEIKAEHILEHFGRDEAIQVLKQWHDWLKTGGIIIIETPDFEEICKNFLKDKYWIARHAYGSQEADWAYHRDAWYAEKFLDILPGIGFDILDIGRHLTRGILPNIRVTAKKSGI